MKFAMSLDAEFAYGSDHVNPVKAVNPGLIYDSIEADYIKFLCGQGFGIPFLEGVTRYNTTCSEATSGTFWDLNYPSFSFYLSLNNC